MQEQEDSIMVWMCLWLPLASVWYRRGQGLHFLCGQSGPRKTQRKALLGQLLSQLIL